MPLSFLRDLAPSQSYRYRRFSPVMKVTEIGFVIPIWCDLRVSSETDYRKAKPTFRAIICLVSLEYAYIAFPQKASYSTKTGRTSLNKTGITKVPGGKLGHGSLVTFMSNTNGDMIAKSNSSQIGPRFNTGQLLEQYLRDCR